MLVCEVSSGSETVRLLARQAENSTSGCGSIWELSPLGSCFSTSVFRNVPRVIPENVRICGFRKKLSNWDSAPKMRDCVRLNSWNSLFVNLPSISSETCVMWSSVIPGAADICNWLLVRRSCVSLAIVAKFCLFLIVAIILEDGKTSTVVKTEVLCFQFRNSTTQNCCFQQRQNFKQRQLIKFLQVRNICSRVQ